MTDHTPLTDADRDALKTLLDAATPVGEWRAVEGDLEGGTLNDYIATLLANRRDDKTSTGRLWLTLAPNDIDPERGAEVVPAMTGDGPRAEANAALVAAALNALPALLDAADDVAARVAEARADEREGWIAYFESWQSAVGAAPFTAENVLRQMRGATPWGCASSEGADR